jgi:hypothetical protein
MDQLVRPDRLRQAERDRPGIAVDRDRAAAQAQVRRPLADVLAGRGRAPPLPGQRVRRRIRGRRDEQVPRGVQPAQAQAVCAPWRVVCVGGWVGDGN